MPPFHSHSHHARRQQCHCRQMNGTIIIMVNTLPLLQLYPPMLLMLMAILGKQWHLYASIITIIIIIIVVSTVVLLAVTAIAAETAMASTAQEPAQCPLMQSIYQSIRTNFVPWVMSTWVTHVLEWNVELFPFSFFPNICVCVCVCALHLSVHCILFLRSALCCSILYERCIWMNSHVLCMSVCVCDVTQWLHALTNIFT